MAEEIKELIEKINREGIKVAEEKAKEIERQALKKADEIVNKAKKEAEKILAEASDKLSKMEEKERALLVQAGRDLILNLKEEINSMLGRLITADLRESLKPEALVKIIIEIAKKHAAEGNEIIVSLNPSDRDILEKDFLAKLREETKKNITLSAQEEIMAGFTISFDNGKSQYDFSERALADYITEFLKPKLKKILSEAVK
jgi:vacuolar-type H+-ATPase subunit E/Vma4